jgi:hypothetical protein
MWSLFHLGFTVDEQLEDRLAFHRAQRHVPAEVFGEGLLVYKPWSKASFEAALQKLGKPKIETVPNGRRVISRVAAPLEACALIAAALLPLEANYPLPYVEAP